MKKREGPTVEFGKVHEKEIKRLKERRKLTNQEEGNPAEDAIGLALSGGGIRSATFNLGLLQAMERFKILTRIDYISTVSGGGYIGSSLTWFMSRLGREFPFGTKRTHYLKEGKVLAWLRAHGNYLIPGDGIGLWALIAAILTGIVVNLVVLVPLFLFIFWLLSQKVGLAPPFFKSIEFLYCYFPNKISTIFAWLLAAGLVIFGLFLILTLLFALTTRFTIYRKFILQRWMRKGTGKLLMWGSLLVVVGTIPNIHDFLAAELPDWITWAMSGVSISGFVSVLGALRGRKEGNEAKGFRSFFMSSGLALLSYGVFLWFYHIISNGAFPVYWLWMILPLSLILAFFADINQVSMHRFYRNRLMEAYLPYKIAEADVEEADHCLLKDIPQTKAPYQIICTNIQTVGSEKPKLRERGGDSFIFSPLYCGAESTCYIKTADYIGGNMNLATAFAISGAAVDPNTYLTRSRPLTFLMTLLNVRLGYWIRNPRKPAPAGSPLRPWWTYYMFSEMLGRGLDEDRRNIHLSDGGHFENLGLYELIRRRCRYIFVSDATADKGWGFNDLGKCIEMVRLDFGAEVNLDTTPMKPDGSENISVHAFVVGDVTYSDGKKADLIYIKTTLVKGLPEDILSYRRANPNFPDQSTVDQFFNERQFEAYRELGYQIGKLLFQKAEQKNLEDWIEQLRSDQGQKADCT